MTSRFSDRFDFTNCEDEPIRTPGAIQPHGFIVLLDDQNLKICGYSANAAEVLNAAFGETDGEADAGQISLPERLKSEVEKSLPDDHAVARSFSIEGYQFSLTRRNNRILLCAEPDDSGASTTVNDLTALIASVKSARSVEELLDTAVRAVRSITGYDRTLVYRFAEDWHGEVVAESRADGMTSYMGLHFPASDIPAQARALYLENEIRMIADVDATPIPVESISGLPKDADPDLTDCPLRAVSPIHLQYLRNMGVAASMSISLVRDGKLWGLIACHHTRPRYLSVGARLSAKLVGDVLSLCLRLVEDSELMQERLRRRLYQSTVLEQCLKSDELVPTITGSIREFLRLFDADGFAVYQKGRVVCTGSGPTEAQFRTLAEKIAARMEADNLTVLHRNQCKDESFVGESTHAAGFLALAPAQEYDVLCIWTRKEEPVTIDWAGRNEKLPEDPLNPRASFGRWSEKQSGVAKEWKNWELEAAEELLVALQKLALRQMERLQRLSENLARSNRDLEDFAFIASHDLQEPLRKIEAFSGMAREELEQNTGDAELIDDYLERVVQASARLRTLVSDLLTYSRVGRLDYDFEECDWRSIIDKSLELLEQQSNYTPFTIEVLGEFPVTRASPVLLRMIFQNLLSNALKYGDEERPNTIVVRGLPSDDRTSWTVEITDTGIGFDPDKAEAIFKPFLRLNSKSKRPGSGIGLAIVNKAADRLGLSISATSVPGEGSRFVVSLSS